jgi:hypothetical protein
MSYSSGISPAHTGSEFADRMAVASFIAAVVGFVIILFTFRGLVFVSLPLAVVAVALGTWGAVAGRRPSARALAVAGLVLGLLCLLLSVAALAANLNVDGGYDFYERRQP